MRTMRAEQRLWQVALGCLVTLAVSVWGSVATASNIYTDGHADIGVDYDGTLNLHFHAHAGATINGVDIPADEEFEPTDVVTIVPGPAQPRPVGAAFDFIGVGAGAPLWRLPQSPQAGVPFLGIASEELDPADWTGEMTWSLLSVVAPPGGEFSLWKSTIGGPVVELSTADGILSFTDPIGSHAHYNYGFTQSGTYLLEFGASAFHNIDGAVSGSGVYTFNVVPEPSTLTLAGIMFLSVAACSLWRRARGYSWS